MILYVFLCMTWYCCFCFFSWIQPKPSANTSTDTEWQSNTTHWYACEEALPKLIVSSAKVWSSGWTKQVGVKMLAWREDKGTTQCKYFYRSRTKLYISNGLYLSWLKHFYNKTCDGLLPSSLEKMMQFLFNTEMWVNWGTSPIRKVKSANLQKTFN